MKKMILLLSFALFYVNMSFGQGISNIWMGGYDNHNPIPYGGWKMDFIAGPPVITYENRAIDFNITGTTIADSSGNFLFATNGVTIMNSAGDTMLNGTGLSPSTYSSPQWFGDGLRIPQATLILPMPGNANLYYLFHMTWDTIIIPPYSYFFYYSLIDMNLDGGKGGVIIKNQVVSTGLYSSNGISACKHANGRDWWINIHDSYGTGLHFFLLSPSGITFSHSQNFNYREGLGFYGFSPDGSKFGGYNTVDDFEIFDFDRCSGMLSNFRQVIVNDSTSWFGSSFSPNSQYLYGSSLRYLYQIDVTSNQPDTTFKVVGIWDGTYYNAHPATFGLLGLAPDGKIYITTPGTTPLMHYIEYPDSNGMACNVIQHSVTLPVYNSATVPNHPNYFLGPLIGSGCDTLTAINNYFDRAPLTLSAYPNPVSASILEINYSLLQNNPGVLEIINTTGQSIYTLSLPQWSSYQNFFLPDIPQGLYLLTLRSGSKYTTLKIIKN